MKKTNNEKQWMLFYVLLHERGRESEVSGKELKGELNSLWFHHILEKSKYPELRFCPNNIIILTADEHHNVSLGNTYDEVEKRKQEIIDNYAELVKDTKEYETTFLNPIYEHSKKHTTFFKKH